ncbi:MAG: 4Fe-4S dicluster domain-containing protein [Candidatus Limnocylindrales bacterium]
MNVAHDGSSAATAYLARSDLDSLIEQLRAGGRRVIGPIVSDGAIIYDEIHDASELPRGWGDEQGPGRYRLTKRDDDRAFGFVVGPTSWKRFTFPPTVPLWRARRDGVEVTFDPAEPEAPPLAFLGVRGCELAALGVQDRVLRDGPFADADFRARRANALIVAVECTTSASTCFCTSMGTGPEVEAGYDLRLTELQAGFLVAARTDAGAAILARLPVRPATDAEQAGGAAAVAAVREGLGDPVATDGLRDRLLANLDSPGWASVAERCLTCANCTLVCPTCFCTSVEQASDLDGLDSIAARTWDSCFTPGFARVAGGGDFRARPQDRYRQWLTHKFATWLDQFGTFGCVGCGRCIAWCPVGIDVRQELAAIAPPTNGRPLDTARMPQFVARPGATDGTPLIVAQTSPPARQRAATDPTVDFTSATVRSSFPETADTVTMVLGDVAPAILAADPGQFVMIERPAFPAVPISISRLSPVHLDLTIRAAGFATAELTGLGPGERVGLRGPLGRGWPIERAVGRDVVVVAGGIGLAPLRPLIDRILGQRGRFGTVRLYIGARTPRDRLFGLDISEWGTRDDVDFAETVDRAGAEWLGRVGVVTHLFDTADWDGSEAVAFVCGPERMMQAAAATLIARGVVPERLYVTMERHMECGVGLCGHCQLGRFFVCKDGPVFSLAELGDSFGREGI